MTLSAESPSVSLFLPKLGQSMEAATVVTWHAADGEAVSEGQVLVSVETDKATYDLESPGTGILHIAVPEGEEVPVETVLGSIGSAVAASSRESPAVAVTQAPAAVPVRKAEQPKQGILASPKAKRLAAELGIDLATVSASAADGVISAEDVKRAAISPGEAGPATETAAITATAARHEVGRERLSGIRKTAARRLQESWQTIPHIVQMVDADASGLLAERERLKRGGQNVSINDLVLFATARALASVPALNVRLEGEELVRYEGVDVGFAVETDRGLLVPVVRGADSLTLDQLAAEVRRLTTAAKASKLRGDDAGGASITVSNLGMQGIRMGTPVINPGEPMLLFVGAVENRPVAVGATVAIRPMLTLSVAYDHRVADGVLAASLTLAIRQAIESHGVAVAGQAGAAEPSLSRKLHSSSAGSRLRVEVRGPNRQAWVLDEPPDDGGSGEGPTPVESFLGALLGCMTMSFKAAARRRNVPIDGIDGSIVANPRRQLTSIALNLHVSSSAPEEDVRALLPSAERGCFVGAVLKGEIEYTITLDVVRSG